MIRALYTLAFALTAILALALYVAKTEAQSAQQRIAMMQHGIVGEQARISQLQDELAHLERPQRLERLARENLGLRPLEPEQETSIGNFEQLQIPAPRRSARLVDVAQNTDSGSSASTGGAQR